MAWSFYNQGVPWRTARRRALDLKEQREEDYYGLEEPTVPAPSLAARRRLEEEMQPSHADAPVEKEEKKENLKRDAGDIVIVVQVRPRKSNDARGTSGLRVTMTMMKQIGLV